MKKQACCPAMLEKVPKTACMLEFAPAMSTASKVKVPKLSTPITVS